MNSRAERTGFDLLREYYEGRVVIHMGAFIFYVLLVASDVSEGSTNNKTNYFMMTWD